MDGPVCLMTQERKRPLRGSLRSHSDMATPSTRAEPRKWRTAPVSRSARPTKSRVRALGVDAAVLIGLTALTAAVYVWTKAPLYNPFGTIDPWLYTALWTNFDQIYDAVSADVLHLAAPVDRSRLPPQRDLRRAHRVARPPHGLLPRRRRAVLRPLQALARGRCGSDRLRRLDRQPDVLQRASLGLPGGRCPDLHDRCVRVLARRGRDRRCFGRRASRSAAPLPRPWSRHASSTSRISLGSRCSTSR